MIKCIRCLSIKDITKFYKEKDNKTGVRQPCKDCRKAKEQKYRINKREYIISYSKKYYAINKKEIIKKKTRLNAIKDNGLYVKYWAMYSRCNYKSSPSYINYGGRGIKIEWSSYQSFKDDMYKSFILHLNQYGKKQTTLDRLNVNENYKKNNCRWATRLQQAENRRPPKKRGLYTKKSFLGKSVSSKKI